MSARRLCDRRMLNADGLGKRSSTAQHEHQQGRNWSPDHDFRLKSGWQEAGGTSVTRVTGLEAAAVTAVWLSSSSR
jgi:hypothetical protein